MTPYGLVPHVRRFRVAGIFDSGFYDSDANWGFVTLKAAQDLAGVGDEVSVIEFRIAEANRAPEFARELAQEAGPDFKAVTWMEQNRPLFRAFALKSLSRRFSWA